jgi:hypothetical protein
MFDQFERLGYGRTVGFRYIPVVERFEGFGIGPSAG